MRRTAHVLLFHSQNISGNTSATNDHLALDESLAAVKAEGLPILPLMRLAEAIRARRFESLPPRSVYLAFDDGTDLDWEPFIHPEFGPQKPMAAILGQHRSLAARLFGKRIPAASFVIASPEARNQIARASGFPISEHWWREAQASGALYVGSHGWDHVHPDVSAVQRRPHLRENFAAVSDKGEAQLQIDSAASYIRGRAGRGAARLFAYPYGQVSEYLAKEYLPAQSEIRAAFTTEPMSIRGDEDVWRLPRYVCGHDWKSPSELMRVLRD
jgi:peptidoglycan/xylan/chitin deacetylase (PgdA/CDA1 family)